MYWSRFAPRSAYDGSIVSVGARGLGLFHFIAATATIFTVAAQAEESNLPDRMSVTSFDVGSAGYAEASAIADAFGKEYGVRIRILPAGSGVGTLRPVVEKRADYGFLATEAFFAAEGIYDFAGRRWGPQNLRALAGRPSTFGMATAADAEIRSIADMEGKRVAYVAGNPSTSAKCDAILSFADLTRDDVEAIMFPTFAASMTSLIQGRADAACSSATSTHLYELGESPRGLHWVEIPPDDEDGWERMTEMAPYFAPFEESVGAGLSDENPANLVAYRYPTITTTADMDADEVYAFIKALDTTFQEYENATSVMPRWNLEMSGTVPVDVPFHEGAIRYLKEIGVWDAQAEAWNNARIDRLDALLAAWDVALEEGAEMDDEEFATLWEEHRQKAIADLN